MGTRVKRTCYSLLLASMLVVPHGTSFAGPSRPGDPTRHVFTQIGNGKKPPTLTIWPCVLSFPGQSLCTDILLTTEQCTAVGGTPYGPEGYPPSGLNGCCAVRGANLYPNLSIVPTVAWTIRNDRYKLVVNERAPCDGPPIEFYDLTARGPLNPLGLDNADDDLLAKGPLDADAQANYQSLSNMLEALLATEVQCPDDGNLDKRVDVKDVVGVRTNRGQPSVFDMDNDGTTDDQDLQVVQANLGRVCSPS